MKTLAAGLLVLLAVAPLAAAQEEDPTVNESDFDTSPPPEGDQYLNESEEEYAEDPTVTESDFDTSVPTQDESYLDEAEAEYAQPGDGSASTGGNARGAGSSADTPAPGLALVLLALAGVALVGRRAS